MNIGQYSCINHSAAMQVWQVTRLPQQTKPNSGLVHGMIRGNAQ